MDSITALTLHAIASDEKRIARVATNLANATTVGYKREVLVESLSASPKAGFADLVDSLGAEGGAAPDGGAMVDTSVVRDMRSATLRPTGRALDVALSGPGFFEVATEQGPAYTRRGDFQLDSAGRLTTAGGKPVLGQGGEITLTSEKPVIDHRGKVMDGDRALAQLHLVDIPSSHLRPIGDGLYVADAEVKDLPESADMVRQGVLENSNVESSREMVELTTSVRHFEALMRITQGRDEMLGTAIRKLGDL